MASRVPLGAQTPRQAAHQREPGRRHTHEHPVRAVRVEAGGRLRRQPEGEAALRIEADLPLVPSRRPALELAHRQAVEELVRQDDRGTRRQRLDVGVPRRAGPGEEAFLRGPQDRAGLHQLRRHAHSRARRPQRPQRVRHQRAAAGPQLHQNQGIGSSHQLVDIGAPGTDQLTEHLADLGRGGEVAPGAQRVAGAVVAVDRMAEAQGHVAIDADRPVLADQRRDLGSEGAHASTAALRSASAAGVATGWRGRVRPVPASTM